MKKALSVLMAGALVASMSVASFAANPAQAGVVYDGDGEKNTDVYASEASLARGYMGDINVDGVVPNAQLYIPLGQSMDSKISDGTPATARPEDAKVFYNAAAKTEYDKAIAEGDDAATALSKISAENVIADDNWTTAAYYSKEDNTLTKLNYTPGSDSSYDVSLNSLTDKDLFKFDVDKDEGSKYIKKIELVSDKKLGSLDRTAYIKISLNDSTTTTDLKSTGTISFKAKKDSAISGESWKSGQKFNLNYTIWINNKKVSGSDGSADTGDRVYFDPESNENNTLVWGDDRAALYFEGNDDASKFYARLSTKADAEIYSTYGDPENADLWFYDFVGNPTVPSTARATLTLGIPWDEDEDVTPNPKDCYIYEKDADGNLIDVTDKFTYSEDNDGTTEIEGWTIKTRTLGTYIVSDTQLDTSANEDVTESTDENNSSSSSSNGGKEIPNTGSSDMVGVAVIAAVVSLAAAGAVAFKKASK